MEARTTIVGNVTRRPERRGDRGPVRFGVAVDRNRKKGDEWEKKTSFFDVVCWQELADNVLESLTQGTMVVVSGRLDQDTWESDQGKRSRIEVVADDVAPSLRNATATVVKNERSNGKAKARSGGRPIPVEYDDETEPF